MFEEKSFNGLAKWFQKLHSRLLIERLRSMGQPVEWIVRIPRIFRFLTGTSEIQNNTIAQIEEDFKWKRNFFNAYFKKPIKINPITK